MSSSCDLRAPRQWSLRLRQDAESNVPSICNQHVANAFAQRGSAGFEFGEDDEELESEAYRLTAPLSAGEGEANVYAYDAEGERVSLGRLSAGEPLSVEAVVEPSSGSVFFVDTGEGEVRGLRYEGRIEPV